MARRELTATAGSRKGLKIDDRLEIQWKHLFDYDECSGEVKSAPPTFEIGRYGEKFQLWNEYGAITCDEDKKWIKSVLEPEGTSAPPPYIARVHEIQIDDAGSQEKIKIEMITGEDAELFLRAQKYRNRLHFIRENWWKFGIAALVAYWWFI